MIDFNRDLRVILIGGSSHVGKSTLAESLALKLGWNYISTDKLARHPGRPWKPKPKTVPKHVGEHYLGLSVDELVADVLRHYGNMWPDIKALVTSHATDISTDRLILEGSALWPESVATLDLENVAATWLTASNELFQTRIYDASRIEEKSGQERTMVQNFLARTHLYNERMMAAIERLGLVSMDVEAASSLDELCDMYLELLRQQSLNAPTNKLQCQGVEP